MYIHLQDVGMLLSFLLFVASFEHLLLLAVRNIPHANYRSVVLARELLRFGQGLGNIFSSLFPIHSSTIEQGQGVQGMM